jgi:uncharacterized protein YicC (UPF0701 family)
MASIDHIHQALLAERDAIRSRGLTFADLVAHPGSTLVGHIYYVPPTTTTTEEETWDHIDAEAREIEKVLLQQRAEARKYKGPTLREYVAQQSKNKKNLTKSVDFTPEEKAAYKARKTSEALAHCQREREKAILRQKAAGFLL